MEIAAIFVAFWLLLVSLYGLWPVMRCGIDDARDAIDDPEYVYRPDAEARQRMASARPSYIPPRPVREPFVAPPVPAATTPVLPVFRSATEIAQLRSEVRPMPSAPGAVNAGRRDVGKKRSRLSRRQTPADLGVPRPVRRHLGEVRTAHQH